MTDVDAHPSHRKRGGVAARPYFARWSAQPGGPSVPLMSHASKPTPARVLDERPPAAVPPSRPVATISMLVATDAS
jgi:hypothetical protein